MYRQVFVIIAAVIFGAVVYALPAPMPLDAATLSPVMGLSSHR